MAEFGRALMMTTVLARGCYDDVLRWTSASGPVLSILRRMLINIRGKTSLHILFFYLCTPLSSLFFSPLVSWLLFLSLLCCYLLFSYLLLSYNLFSSLLLYSILLSSLFVFLFCVCLCVYSSLFYSPLSYSSFSYSPLFYSPLALSSFIL